MCKFKKYILLFDTHIEDIITIHCEINLYMIREEKYVAKKNYADLYTNTTYKYLTCCLVDFRYI